MIKNIILVILLVIPPYVNAGRSDLTWGDNAVMESENNDARIAELEARVGNTTTNEDAKREKVLQGTALVFANCAALYKVVAVMTEDQSFIELSNGASVACMYFASNSGIADHNGYCDGRTVVATSRMVSIIESDNGDAFTTEGNICNAYLDLQKDAVQDMLKQLYSK